MSRFSSSLPPTASHYFLYFLYFGLVLQVAVVQLPFLNRAFGTVPLAIDQWALCVAMGSLVLWSSELHKFLLHRSLLADMH